MRPDVVADVATIVSDCATQPDAATHSVTALHMITCEYPPQLGGVADFTRTIADRVAQTGREVHVWAPGTTGTVVEASGVIVHREFGSFSLRDRKRVASLLDETARDRTLFLQWVPHGFGARAMNVGFCLWLRDRVRHHDERLDLMVHEPFLPFRGSSWRAKLAAVVQRAMMAVLLRAATVTWVSTTSWIPRLRGLAPDTVRFNWLPVPSPFPIDRDVEKVAKRRYDLAEPAETLVGHLGTYGTATLGLLTDAICRIAHLKPSATFLLFGRGSDGARDRMLHKYPVLENRLRATGVLDAASISQQMQACHLMIQPYPDGVSCRRTSLIAALAHGLPVVTTTGELTEPMWAAQRAVELVAAADAEQFARRSGALIDDELRRTALGARAAAMYEKHLSADRAVEMLTAYLDGVPA